MIMNSSDTGKKQTNKNTFYRNELNEHFDNIMRLAETCMLKDEQTSLTPNPEKTQSVVHL